MKIQAANILTILATRVVRPGCEEAFEASLHDFIQRSTLADGQLGVQVVRPSPGSGSRVYSILRRFASEQARDDFYASSLFRDWDQAVTPLTEGESQREEMSGLEAWFNAPGHPIQSPPRWKMSLVTIIGVYPLSLFLPWVLNFFAADWPSWLRGLAMSAIMVVILTWFVMPRLAHLFHKWLYNQRKRF